MDTQPALNTKGAPLASRVRWSWVIWYFFTVTGFFQISKVNVGQMMAFGPFRTEMHLSGHPALASLLMTLFLLTYGVAIAFWGFMSDRIGPKKVAIIGMSIAAAAMVLGALAPNITVLLISRVMLGAGTGVMWPICNHMTARWFPVVERGTATGVWLSGTNMGAVLTFAAIPFLLFTIGWRWVMVIIACLFLLLVAYFALFLKDDPRKDPRVSAKELEVIEAGTLKLTEQVPQHAESAERSSFRNYRFWFTSICNISTAMSIWGLMFWLPSYLVKIRHMSLTGQGLYTAIATLIGIGVSIWFGHLTDRKVHRAVYGLICYVVYIVFLLSAIFVGNIILLIIFMGIALIVIQTSGVPVFSLLHSFGGERRMGSQAGIMAGFSNLLTAWGPLVMGLFLQQGPGGWTASFVFLAGMALLAAVLMAILVVQKF